MAAEMLAQFFLFFSRKNRRKKERAPFAKTSVLSLVNKCLPWYKVQQQVRPSWFFILWQDVCLFPYPDPGAPPLDLLFPVSRFALDLRTSNGALWTWHARAACASASLRCSCSPLLTQLLLFFEKKRKRKRGPPKSDFGGGAPASNRTLPAPSQLKKRIIDLRADTLLKSGPEYKFRISAPCAFKERFKNPSGNLEQQQQNCHFLS